MKPQSHEEHKQHTFDYFCKRILRNEARDYYDELNRRREHEISLDELVGQELGELSVTDEYFKTEQTFNVFGQAVVVEDELIAKALQALPQEKRDIILLSYFLEMSDREIGEKLNMIRATVQYKRTSTLKQLKNFMEGQADE